MYPHKCGTPPFLSESILLEIDFLSAESFDHPATWPVCAQLTFCWNSWVLLISKDSFVARPKRAVPTDPRRLWRSHINQEFGSQRDEYLHIRLHFTYTMCRLEKEVLVIYSVYWAFTVCQGEDYRSELAHRPQGRQDLHMYIRWKVWSAPNIKTNCQRRKM